jgi:hypothetical protein
MEILITQWALDSYLELKSQHKICEAEYWQRIRPDVMLLKAFPHEPKFSQGKFWSAAQDRSGEAIANGYKIKWHQVGEGLAQLRLTIGIFDNQCFLCEAYIKSNEKAEKRQLARFKTYLQLIRQGRYTIRGRLT